MKNLNKFKAEKIVVAGIKRECSRFMAHSR